MLLLVACHKHTHLVLCVPLVHCAAYGCDGHCRLGSRVAGLHAAHMHTPGSVIETLAACARQPSAHQRVLQHTPVHCTCFFSLCVPPVDSTTCCTSMRFVFCNRLPWTGSHVQAGVHHHPPCMSQPAGSHPSTWQTCRPSSQGPPDNRSSSSSRQTNSRTDQAGLCSQSALDAQHTQTTDVAGQCASLECQGRQLAAGGPQQTCDSPHQVLVGTVASIETRPELLRAQGVHTHRVQVMLSCV
jgi:hypothetical protein